MAQPRPLVAFPTNCSPGRARCLALRRLWQSPRRAARSHVGTASGCFEGCASPQTTRATGLPTYGPACRGGCGRTECCRAFPSSVGYFLWARISGRPRSLSPNRPEPRPPPPSSSIPRRPAVRTGGPPGAQD
eukprot:scaffold6195_cov428-Prasinococcus_capsulatus_cf.AAC.6